MNTKTSQRQLFIFIILLIILVPLTALANLLWTTSNFTTVEDEWINSTAQQTASTLNSLIAAKIRAKDPGEVQAIVQAFAKNHPDYIEITVYRLDNNQLVNVATNNPDHELTVLNDLSKTAWWTNGTTFGELKNTDTGIQQWAIFAPITDTDGQKLGVTHLRINSSDSDKNIADAYYGSFMIFLFSCGFLIFLIIAYYVLIGSKAGQKNESRSPEIKTGLISESINDFSSILELLNKNYVNLAQGDYDSVIDKNGQQYLEGVHNHSYHLSSLSERLLDLNKIERGELAIPKTHVDLTSVIEDQIEKNKGAASTHATQIIHNKLDQRVVVIGNKKHISECVAGLFEVINNHTTKGNVTISYSLIDQKQWRVSIATSGFYMNQYEQEPVKQEQTMTNLDFATSLGAEYWIVQQLMQKIGGTMQCNYKPVASALFELDLPAVQAS